MRYSLRLFGLSIALLAVILAAWTEDARQQRAAVVEVYALGGSVKYDHGPLAVLEPLLGVDFVANVSVVHLSRFEDPTAFHHVTDVGALIPVLQRLPRLRKIVGLFNHAEDLPRLQQSLPDVEVEIGIGGVI